MEAASAFQKVGFRQRIRREEKCERGPSGSPFAHLEAAFLLCQMLSQADQLARLAFRVARAVSVMP